MNTDDRRRFKRAFSNILTASGDCCEFCGRPLQQKINTFDDIAAKSLTVGECCVEKVTSELSPNVDSPNINADFSQTNQQAKISHLVPESLTTAFESMRSHFEAVNTLSVKLMKQAGIQSMPSNIFFGEYFLES